MSSLLLVSHLQFKKLWFVLIAYLNVNLVSGFDSHVVTMLCCVSVDWAALQ